jgi:molybdenum cofactor cytidylyltransferase
MFIVTEQSIINHCGIIVLAAGGSTRLGKPKQLLPYKGKTLLQHSADTAINAMIGPVVIVAGCDARLIAQQVNERRVIVAINEHWQNGMASSIVCGLQLLLSIHPETDGVIIMMNDQPFVTTALLHDLVNTQQQTAKPMVASGYNNTIGVPALFYKTIFRQLLHLSGDAGARKILQQQLPDVATVSFARGDIDIDTPEDYGKLLQSE